LELFLDIIYGIIISR